MAVRIDDEATWPPAVVTVLTRRLAAFSSDAKASERARRRAFDGIGDEIHSILSTAELVCCHCTRLTSDEVEQVRRVGLRPLSVSLCEERVAKRVLAGDLTQVQGNRMLSIYRRQRSESNSTESRIWSVLGRAALRDEDGFGLPLSYWGGEAMLELPAGAHYRIGEACIVEFVIDVSQPRTNHLAEAFVDQFLFDRDLFREDGAYDVCIADAVPASSVRA